LSEWVLPDGIYDSVNQYVYSNNKGSYYKIYPNSKFNKRARNVPAKYPKVLEGGYWGIIPRGRILGKNGSIISPDNKLIWDVSHEYVNKRAEHSIFQYKKLPPISCELDTAADLTHAFSNNYYHWIFDIFTRIHLIKLSGVKFNKYIINEDSNPLPYKKETLALVGIEETDLIKTHENSHIQVDHLVVPSQPIWPTKWGFNYLRNVFLPPKNSNQMKYRIFISRKSYRRIINEEELMSLLSTYGFMMLDLESLPVEKQVELFSCAEIVIATHGAGLTNITFCNPGTKVIELFPPHFIHCHYWMISSFGNLDYHFFIGESGIRNQEFSNQSWSGYDNLNINIDQFHEFIKGIGL
jgi:capsular polysaccharide biosynthesis protein